MPGKRERRCKAAALLVLSPEKTVDVSRGRLLSPRKTTSEYRAQKFHTDDEHYPDLGIDSGWLQENSLAEQPIRSTTKIWVVHVISMEFVRSLLRRRFARAQVRPLRNVGYFLRLLVLRIC